MPYTTKDVRGLWSKASRPIHPQPPLTCAPTALVEELEGPPFPVVHVSKGVGAAPGPSVRPHPLTPSPALQGPADVARLRPQGRAAALQAKGVRRHAGTRELRLHPGGTAAAQVAQSSPAEPPQGAHYGPVPALPLRWTRVSWAGRSAPWDNLALPRLHAPAEQDWSLSPPRMLVMGVCLIPVSSCLECGSKDRSFGSAVPAQQPQLWAGFI